MRYAHAFLPPLPLTRRFEAALTLRCSAQNSKWNRLTVVGQFERFVKKRLQNACQPAFTRNVVQTKRTPVAM
jgi:hypothetical protein